MFICLSNVSSQMCCELVLQGMLTVVHNLLSSLCKEHCTVSQFHTCGFVCAQCARQLLVVPTEN